MKTKIDCAFTLTILILSRSSLLSAYQTIKSMSGSEARARIHDFPFILSFPYQYDNNYGCVGVIVNERWALTVASCIINNMWLRSGSSFIIREESPSLRTFDSDEGVSELYLHEVTKKVYGPSKGLVLLQVSPDFNFSDSRVAPVNLPTQGEKTPGGKKGVVIGWNTTDTDKLQVDVDENYPDLLTTTMFVYREAKCYITAVKEYSTGNEKPFMCAQDPESNFAFCRYDGGNPILVDGVLFGVFWKKPELIDYCLPPHKAKIFHAISGERTWIDETIAENSET